jgi:hypothetical protein
MVTQVYIGIYVFKKTCLQVKWCLSEQSVSCWPLWSKVEYEGWDDHDCFDLRVPYQFHDILYLFSLETLNSKFGIFTLFAICLIPCSPAPPAKVHKDCCQRSQDQETTSCIAQSSVASTWPNSIGMVVCFLSAKFTVHDDMIWHSFSQYLVQSLHHSPLQECKAPFQEEGTWTSLSCLHHAWVDFSPVW